ncbi:MAG: hypothetical protein ABR520_02175 [Mycobacteriales bacterium]|nr:hypothetical protein [Frankia sp.]
MLATTYADVAAALEERAEEYARALVEKGLGADATPLSTDGSPGTSAAISRRQWRDAGIARTLRDAARQLREWEEEGGGARQRLVLRVQAWLTSQEIEYDAAADAAMTGLLASEVENAGERASVVAHSAYFVGMARGTRIAREICTSLLRNP